MSSAIVTKTLIPDPLFSHHKSPADIPRNPLYDPALSQLIVTILCLSVTSIHIVKCNTCVWASKNKAYIKVPANILDFNIQVR